MVHTEDIFNIDARGNVQRQRNIVTAAFVWCQILHFRFLSAGPMSSTSHRTDSVGHCWWIEARTNNHREDELVSTVVVPQRVEVANSDVDLLARFDIGHLLSKDIRPFLGH